MRPRVPRSLAVAGGGQSRHGAPANLSPGAVFSPTLVRYLQFTHSHVHPTPRCPAHCRPEVHSPTAPQEPTGWDRGAVPRGAEVVTAVTLLRGWLALPDGRCLGIPCHPEARLLLGTPEPAQWLHHGRKEAGTSQ